MRDRRMGMGRVGCVFLLLNQNNFPLPCEQVGLAAKQLQVRRKEVACVPCCASCQLSPGQEPAPYVPSPSEEEDIAALHSFLTSFAHFTFEIVNFQAYLRSSRNFLPRRLLLALMTVFFVFALARCETCFDLFSHYENAFIYDAQQGDS